MRWRMPVASSLGVQRFLGGIAQPIASAPNGLDVASAAHRLSSLYGQMAGKNIDKLERRLMLSAVEVARKHLTAHHGALARAEQPERQYSSSLSCQRRNASSGVRAPLRTAVSIAALRRTTQRVVLGNDRSSLGGDPLIALLTESSPGL